MADLVTVCWIQHGGEIEWAKAIAGQLQRQGIAIRFVSFLREFSDGYTAAGWASDFIAEIFAPEHRLDEAELRELERRYGPPALRCLAASDVHLETLYGNDEAMKVQIVGRALRWWEAYFARHGIEAAIVRDEASFSTRCARHVADRLGTVRIIRIGVGPDNRHLVLCDIDNSWCWSELIEELAGGPRPIPPARGDAVEAYVADRVQPARARPMALNLDVPPLRHLPIMLYRMWRDERGIDRHRDPIGPTLLRLRRAFMLKRTAWYWTRRLFRYDEPRDEPYVYFPLFHTNETGHLVNIRYWCRHLEDLVAQLAEALPIGHKLYVKEHPAVLGDLSRAALRRMRANPAVRIMSPTMQSQTLIAKARAVVSLEGTAGWEALLLRRPVVVLSGKPFYVRCPGVFSVDDVCALDRVLPQAIFAGDAGYLADNKSVWLWFIDCVMRTILPGVIETYEFPHVTPQQSENLTNVANALSHKIRAATGPSRTMKLATASS